MPKARMLRLLETRKKLRTTDGKLGGLLVLTRQSVAHQTPCEKAVLDRILKTATVQRLDLARRTCICTEAGTPFDTQLDVRSTSHLQADLPVFGFSSMSMLWKRRALVVLGVLYLTRLC